ncbi:MAG: hypothetical protein UW69_C0040G0001 [Microgenomates group bacterium GW2011_GWA2_44_7]|nr:MAG: hypothetical protein UW69_C0040G0001 [Microgenomates group bacterium GW2011_GWA2_44_7]
MSAIELKGLRVGQVEGFPVWVYRGSGEIGKMGYRVEIILVHQSDHEQSERILMSCDKVIAAKRTGRSDMARVVYRREEAKLFADLLIRENRVPESVADEVASSNLLVDEEMLEIFSAYTQGKPLIFIHCPVQKVLIVGELIADLEQRT